MLPWRKQFRHELLELRQIILAMSVGNDGARRRLLLLTTPIVPPNIGRCGIVAHGARVQVELTGRSDSQSRYDLRGTGRENGIQGAGQSGNRSRKGEECGVGPRLMNQQPTGGAFISTAIGPCRRIVPCLPLPDLTPSAPMCSGLQ